MGDNVVDFFEPAIQYVLQNEGGYADHAEDNGGPTNFGITCKTLSDFLGRPVTSADIATLQVEKAKAIYRKNFWAPMKLECIIDLGVATALLDMGVNRGVKKCVEYAQLTCRAISGKCTVDGVVGPETLLGINGISPISFITMFCEEITHGYKKIVEKHPEQAPFLAGWLNRAERMMTLV